MRNRTVTKNFLAMAARLPGFEPPSSLTINEIRSGVSNFVFLVKASEKSYILKQAKKKLKSNAFSQFRSDPLKRMQLEFKVARIYREILGDIIPAYYLFEPDQKTILMQAFENSTLLKERLLAGELDSEAIERLGYAVGKLHQQTFNIYSKEKEFINPDALRKEISTHYIDIAGLFGPKLSPIAKKAALQHLKDKSVLIHGDITTSNILLDSQKIHLIDFELAHLGSPEYELGHFLPDLFLFAEGNPSKKQPVRETLQKFLENYCKEFKAKPFEEMSEKIAKHCAVITRYRTDGLSKTPFVKDPRIKQQIRKKTNYLLKKGSSAEQAIELFT